MGVKYSLPFRAFDDTACRVDISISTYSGAPKVITGQSGKACIIDRDPETTDDPYSVFIRSTCTLNFYDEKHIIDLSEMQNAQDKDFVVQVYIDSDLKWQGYIIPDGIQSPMKAVPEITIQCTDGLSLLTDMPFVYADNLPGTTSDPNRCPMNFIRLILFNTHNLGLPLPIHWTNSLQCTAFNDEMFTESVKWGLLGEGWTSFQSPDPANPQDGYVSQKCEYILAGIIKSIQGRLFQDNGTWVIRRINDIVSGTFTDNSIAGDQGIMTITTVTKDANKVIGAGGYPFIGENQLTTVRKGVKTCKTTYNANVRENILPNGNQDMVNSLSPSPFYWGLVDTTDSTAVSVDGIDGRSGSATDLTNPGDGSGSTSLFTQVDFSGSRRGITIDAFTLIKRIQFGFVFEPVNGFPFDPTTGIIDFSGNPFQIQIRYTYDTTQLYLDEFAIWRTDAGTKISIQVDGTKINDIIQIDFNKNNAIIIPKPAAELVANGLCEIEVFFELKDGQRYTLDYIYFTIDENNDIFESTYDSINTAVDERTLEISSSFGGYFVSNYMTQQCNSNAECFYTDGIYTGTLTGMTSNAIMRFLYKSSVIYNGDMNVRGQNWSFDEIYTIDTLTGKFLPLQASWNLETCEVSLIVIECRSDNISLTEKHYGSNDQVLSN